MDLFGFVFLINIWVGVVTEIGYTPFADTIKFIEDLYGDKIVSQELSIDELCESVGYNNRTKLGHNYICTREEYIRRNGVISEYMLKRGFARETLEKFNVYSCKEKTRFANRALVPLYDPTGKFLIGISGRSECGNPIKWLHTRGFPSSTHLYNGWNAENVIKKTCSVWIVESPGNVWRLEETGIKNSVALFGTNFTAAKASAIDKMGVSRINLLMDNDTAGEEAIKRITQEYHQFYNIKVYEIPKEYNDVADMPVNKVKEILNV